MTQRTFYAYEWDAPEDTPEEVPADDVHTIRYGYNLADLDNLARISTRRSFGAAIGDFIDRYETAYSAIVETLLSADQRPDQRDLLAAGSRAIIDHRAQEAHHHGWSRRKQGTQAAYMRYWQWASAHAASPEKAVVESAALWQVWGTLPDRYREAFLALAATGDLEAATRRLGITRDAMKGRLKRGRVAFLALWHEHESPSHAPWRAHHPKGKRFDRFGKARLTVGQVEQIRGRAWAGETRASIAADYGVAKSTIGRHARGVVGAVAE